MKKILIAVLLFNFLSCQQNTNNSLCLTSPDDIKTYLNERLERKDYCAEVYNPDWKVVFYDALNCVLYKTMSTSDRCLPTSVLVDSLGNKYLLTCCNWNTFGRDENLLELRQFIKRNGIACTQRGKIRDIIMQHYYYMDIMGSDDIERYRNEIINSLDKEEQFDVKKFNHHIDSIKANFDFFIHHNDKLLGFDIDCEVPDFHSMIIDKNYFYLE